MAETMIRFFMNVFGVSPETAFMILMGLPVILGLPAVVYLRVSELRDRKRKVERMMGRKIPWRIFLPINKLVERTPPTSQELAAIRAEGQARMVIDRLFHQKKKGK